MTVRAAVLNAPQSPFEIQTLELEPPKAGEVLFRMEAAGVCHSDWHLVTGDTKHPMPVVPGHEGAGIVEAIGPNVTHIQANQSVILNWAPSCGDCFYCQHGRPSLCQTYVESIWAGVMLDGTTRFRRSGEPVYSFSSLGCFAEKIVVPEVCCVPIVANIPASVAALIGCAVTTGVGAVLNTAKVEPDSSVAVFGVGGVGMSTVLGAKLAGATTIIAIDKSEATLDMALNLGATHKISAGPKAVAQVQELTEGRGADYVFEAVGIPALQEACLAAARPGGTIILAGIAPMGSATNLPGATITRQEKTVMGCYYGTSNPPADFPHLAEMFVNGSLDLGALISQSYTLEQINDAYADMLSGRPGRGVIVF